MKTRLLFCSLLLAATSRVAAQQPWVSSDSLTTCDLLFHVSGSANHITDVTEGVGQRRIDHVAIFVRVSGHPCVVEAVRRGVVVTPLDSLRRHGYWLVGRISVAFDRQQSIGHALSYLGRPYDEVFLADNEAIYCSELVQLSFVDEQGQRLFGTIPMSFHDASGAITPYWQQFYAERHMAVPEGQPGTNPGELSRREEIKILGVLLPES